MEASSQGSLGGDEIYRRCPQCGHAVPLLDRKFLRHGPIRCGACGAELRSALVPSLIADAMESAQER